MLRAEKRRLEISIHDLLTNMASFMHRLANPGEQHAPAKCGRRSCATTYGSLEAGRFVVRISGHASSIADNPIVDISRKGRDYPSKEGRNRRRVYYAPLSADMFVASKDASDLEEWGHPTCGSLVAT